MQAEIDVLLSDKASPRVAEVINQLAELFDDLFCIAKTRGASDRVLNQINEFIEAGMTRLVHTFSGFFDDEIKELRAFVSLLKTRKNEAIWCEVFTFYFKFSQLEAAPPALAFDFVSHFWQCFLRAHDDGVRSGQAKEPYYTARVTKIFYENIFGAYFDRESATKTYDNPDFIKLFERYSLEIAEKSSKEKAEKIETWLIVPTVQAGR